MLKQLSGIAGGSRDVRGAGPLAVTARCELASCRKTPRCLPKPKTPSPGLAVCGTCADASAADPMEGSLNSLLEVGFDCIPATESSFIASVSNGLAFGRES